MIADLQMIDLETQDYWLAWLCQRPEWKPQYTAAQFWRGESEDPMMDVISARADTGLTHGAFVGGVE